MLTDPICIVAAITLIQMIMLPGVSPMEGLESIFLAFGMSSLIGLIVGLIWALILNKLKGKPHYMITIAVLFITYILSEEMGGHGGGPIAALLFGLILANFNFIMKVFDSKREAQFDIIEMRHFHEEVTFFIKSFFFVYIGLIISISTKDLIFGLVLTGICLTIRFISASITAFIMNFSKTERALSRFIFAHGLPALIMSQLPAIYDPNKQYFLAPEMYTNLCFIIVLGTVIYGAVLGPYIVKKRLGLSRS